MKEDFSVYVTDTRTSLGPNVGKLPSQKRNLDSWSLCRNSRVPAVLLQGNSTDAYMLTNSRRHSSVLLSCRARENIFTRTRTQDRFSWLFLNFCNLLAETNKVGLGAVLPSCLVCELQKSSSRELEHPLLFVKMLNGEERRALYRKVACLP
jgi:hypothetical protein